MKKKDAGIKIKDEKRRGGFRIHSFTWKFGRRIELDKFHIKFDIDWSLISRVMNYYLIFMST